VKNAKRTSKTADMDAAILAIARREFGVETLEERRMDALDFYSVGVLNIRDALEKAYLAGKAAK